MKALRVPLEGLAEGESELDVDASNYVLRVHRLTVGDPLFLFDPEQGSEADATLLGVHGRLARVAIRSVRIAASTARRRLVLLQAHAKGDKVERVVRDATALGVTELWVVATERSIVQLEQDASSRRGERFRRIAVEAARQCGRGDVPSLHGPVSFEQLAAHCGGWPATRWVLSPDGRYSLGERLSAQRDEPVALFIGPEGGFSERELSWLMDHGFESVRFGKFILRTETAATAVLGAIAASTRES